MNDSQNQNPIHLLQVLLCDLQMFIFADIKTYQVNNHQQNSIQLLQLSRLNLQTLIFADIKTYQVNNYH